MPKGFRPRALFPKIRRTRGIGTVSLRTPYLLFIGDAPDQLAAKTAAGIAFWRPEISRGQFRLPGCNADLGIPDMNIEEAAAAGVKTVIVGTTNRGGVLGGGWERLLVRALELGMDLASGLHHRLTDIPALRDAAARYGRQIADVRHPTREFAIGNGIKRPGKRLLTVGTDCSIGKMFTALALEKEMRRRGLNADFRATGQTGILIAGDGVSIDAVVSDFVAGALDGAAARDYLRQTEDQLGLPCVDPVRTGIGAIVDHLFG